MAKPMLVTLPARAAAAGLVAARAAGRRPGRRRLVPGALVVLEKLPLLALSAAASVARPSARRPAAGAMASVTGLPLGSASRNALLSHVGLPREDCSGRRSSPCSTRSRSGAVPCWQAGAARCARWSAISAAAILRAGAGPAFWSGGSGTSARSLPVIGLVQVGAQALADRYTYLPLIGLVLHGRLGRGGRLRPRAEDRRRSVAAAALALAALSAATWAQASPGARARPCSRHALAVTRRQLGRPSNGYAVPLRSRAGRQRGTNSSGGRSRSTPCSALRFSIAPATTTPNAAWPGRRRSSTGRRWRSSRTTGPSRRSCAPSGMPQTRRRRQPRRPRIRTRDCAEIRAGRRLLPRLAFRPGRPPPERL